MGRHAAPRSTAERRKLRRRVVGTTILTAGLVAGFAPAGFAGGAVNSLTVTVTADQSSVTSGDFATFTIAVKNVGTKSTRWAELTNVIANGTPVALTQTGSTGTDTWVCDTVSHCQIGSAATPTVGIAPGVTDTFRATVQAGSTGMLTDTATVVTHDLDNGSTTTASGSTAVTSGSSGGGSVTITGFCPKTGCDIKSSANNPTDSNLTVSHVIFPACIYATPATQSRCQNGFSYSYVLAPANFCSVNLNGGTCTGSTANLGDLQTSNGKPLPQFEDPAHPIIVRLVYDASITTGLSAQQGVLFKYESQDPNGNGELLAACGSVLANGSACDAGDSKSQDGAEGDTDLQGETDILSHDPYVGNYYVL
jgi:uncharacterized repeat protein (TIGR01451 family)